MRQTADTTQAIVFENAASAVIGAIATTGAATAYNTTSDIRLKSGIEAFDAGRIVDDTETFSFRFKAGGDDRHYGVSAQQANEVFPQAVTHMEKEDVWMIDYSKYVPVLLNELKALRARVAQLEDKLEGKPA